jgi:hypothetical protein
MAGFNTSIASPLAASGNATANQTASQQPSAQTRKRMNQQKQRPFAAQNGMGAQRLPLQQPAGPDQSVSSPVTATGQISTAQPATMQPLPEFQKLPAGAAGSMSPNTGVSTQVRNPAPATGGVQPAPGAPPTGGVQPAPGAAPTYQPQALANASSQAILNALANPMYSQQWIAQQKGQLRDQNALALQQQQQQQIQQNAGAGTFGSGAMASNLARMGENAQSTLLNNYRQTDLDAVRGNRDDQYRWADMGMNNYYQGRGQDLQHQLGMAGVDADRYRTRAGLTGDLLGYQMGMNQLGYNYTALNASQRQALMNSLLR